MKIRIAKKIFLGVALSLLLFGSTVANAQSITCQGAHSFGPSTPIHMNAVGF